MLELSKKGGPIGGSPDDLREVASWSTQFRKYSDVRAPIAEELPLEELPSYSFTVPVRSVRVSVGVEPFAAYADATYPTLLVEPANNQADLGLVGSTVAGGLVNEAGQAMYPDSSGLMFVKTFTAKKKGTASFVADAADVFGNEIYVTGLTDALPLSQVTFGSTTMNIKN